MYRTYSIYSIALSFALLCVIVAGRAEAGQRAFVAPYGSDTNNCALATPCRGFQAAINAVDPNGEVVVLDSGGYGAVTVNKSVAITAPSGIYAGISVFPGFNGVTINTAGVKVVLRGLTINGQGGVNGINMTAGASLTVDNCLIANLTQAGIDVVTNTAVSVRITDTTIRDNGQQGLLLENGARAVVTRATISGNAGVGVVARGTVAGIFTGASIGDSTISGNGEGIIAVSENATAAVRVSVRDSRVVQNADVNVSAESTSAAVVILTVSNNIIAGSAVGIRSLGAGAKVWASGNTVSVNSIGLSNSGGLFESAGDNAVRNNVTNASAGITLIPTM